MFEHWHKYHANAISRRTFYRRMAPVREQIDPPVRAACSRNARLVGMCNELYSHRNWILNFVDQDRTEPMNNTAEHALRHAVI